jgi:sugar/nucleoside kinase (ribokinase family)
VLVVGDVMVDVVGVVPGLTADEACAAGHVQADLDTRPGGAGLVAALAAREAGVPEVGLWTSVGADASAETVRETMRRNGVDDLMRIDPDHPTGTVVCLELDGGQRLMVASPGANPVVCSGGPEEPVLGYAGGTDLLYVSGYVLRFPDRAAQVERLIDRVRGNGGLMLLDLVPHRIDAQAPGLRRVLDRTDVIVGEENTFRRVFGVGADRDVGWLAGHVLERHRLALIRTSNETELRASAHGRTWADTGYGAVPAEARAGYLDRRAVRVVCGWLADG